MDKCKECGQPKRSDPPEDSAPKVTLEWRCGTGEEFLRWLRRNIKSAGTGAS